MTEDEVDIIYNYLHQNCIYKDGELIRKISSYGQTIGRKIGHVVLEEKDRNGKFKPPSVRAKMKINGKIYNKNLRILVYIFHHKKYPDNLNRIDGNPLNTKIENLIIRDKKELYKSRILNSSVIRPNKGITFVKEKNKFRAATGLDGKRLFIGYFEDEINAIKAVEYIRGLYFNDNLSPNELRKIIIDKYRIKSEIGIKNIIKSRSGNRFGYSFMINGISHRKVSFKTIEDAVKALIDAKKKITCNL